MTNSKPDLQALLAQKAELEKQTADIEKQLKDARQAERNAVIANIKELLSKHGLTVADLGLKSGASERKTPGPSSGQPVAPKYKDVTSGKTWSGRGLKPKWVAEALAQGKTLDDLKI